MGRLWGISMRGRGVYYPGGIVAEMAIGPGISQSFYHMDTQYSMHGASTSRRQLTRTTLARTYFTLFCFRRVPPFLDSFMLRSFRPRSPQLCASLVPKLR